MSGGFRLGGALGRRLHEALGGRAEHSDAETDRATREARIEHETRLEERRSEFDRLRTEVEDLPEFAIDLEAGQHLFASIYTPAILRLREGYDAPGMYGITVPAERLGYALPDDAMAMLAGHLKVRPAKSGRSDMPWDYVGLRSKMRPEVYTIGQDGRENQPDDLDWLIREVQRIEARNRHADLVFTGKRLRVHGKLYAYWSGSLSFDRQGIAIGLRRVGVRRPADG